MICVVTITAESKANYNTTPYNAVIEYTVVLFYNKAKNPDPFAAYGLCLILESHKKGFL